MRTVVFAVPAAPASAGLARAMFRAVLNSWRSKVDEATATLLLSELITNAVMHGVPAPGLAFMIGVEVSETIGGLHVEVHDPDLGTSGRVAVCRGVEDQDEGGRGLELVNAMASSWGERTTAVGKCVYFDVPHVAGDAHVNRPACGKALSRAGSGAMRNSLVALGRWR